MSLSAALWLAGCSKPEPAAEPVRSVKVLTVSPSALGSVYEYSGEVKARVDSRLGFRVAGKIIRRQAELGQRVKVGQVLAQLDPQDYQLGADAARAQVASAQTNRDLAAADYRRYKELFDKNFIGGSELQRRETTLKSAQASLEQAQAQLASQGNQIAYTSLVADVAGVVTAIEAEPGQVVQAGSPVVRIAQDGPRDVVFAVPEDKVAGVKVGANVVVKVWSENRQIEGQVREVAASADPVTRTYSVKVALPSQGAPALGATVNVLPQGLARAEVAVIKLPTSALRQEGRKSAVWLLDPSSMTVRLQPVEIATADGNEAVIAGGLKPGDQVVVAGVHVLSPGQKVSLYQPKKAVAGAAMSESPTAPTAAAADAPPAAAAVAGSGK
ncbi:efflux RND transporter periplasmic adaptor subunit [Curvibacter sp. HBC28]|uniref:Efflux RND transporter periplasmic adaptor subunit n=1 Tax=Curvibacter microcysteis TaxID=3026419 RepID=A0ABT5MI07_9BURK|nr:efflux RND transporter periplasmic adaptor subunit [Curvibacter sp. HBC28]MDD0814815.1 efflux RND transporter periplasmic adaptor subunit [Curvibacter sp. HBC28]